MKEKIGHIFRQNGILLLVLLFVILNLVFISHNQYFFLLAPFTVLIGFLAIYAMDKLLLITVFFVPLSYPLETMYPDLGFNLQLPTEIMIIALTLVFLYKVLWERDFDPSISRHPISIIIYLYLAWMLVTSVTSTMPLVSLKYFISRTWFIVVFYFLATQLFAQKRNIRMYFYTFFASLLLVMIWATTRMISKGIFDPMSAQLSAKPFFKEHTSYGAIIALVIPFLASLLFYKKYTPAFRVTLFVLLGITIAALVLSYTRAAWISVGAAVFVWLMMRWRVKFLYLSILIILGFVIIRANWSEIVISMEQNEQDSSKEFKKHLQSVYNIRSDASNLERINRWKCALKMFDEKPVFGWGPGTYMFQYAPFQVSHDKTVISTNLGDWGNAHSEYLGPLAESGLLGTFTFVLLAVGVFYMSIKLYSSGKIKKSTRLLLTGAILGLVTYFIHGFLNNFLDSDKASALFWGYIAMITAIDVYHRKDSESDEVRGDEVMR